jgi:hypothetical protein
MAARKKPPSARLPRRRVAIGPPRPQYLDSPDVDKVVMMLLALAADVSVLRDRLDTHEALAEKRTAPTSRRVEAYKLDAQRRTAREQQRHAMMQRVLRVLTEEADAVREAAASRG